MSKADKLNILGTTKKRIAKKEIPTPTKKIEEVVQKTPPVEVKKVTSVAVKKVKTKAPSEEKIKKTNVELSETLHFKAKVTAMEQGMTLKGYITNLIKADLRKRGKL